ncbi:DUF3347 domain-containing protein, partial [bacterium]|nr:DUF3347 domain-containing protein [bacterium]
ESLAELYTAYLALQEELADDDVEAARTAADAVRSAVDAVRDETLVGAPLADWRRLRPQLAYEPADTSIEGLREAFEPLSDAILATERRFGHDLDRMLARAYCPMAFGNAGAEWLQAGTTIDNPYFGAMMLLCGEVREELPPRGAEGASQDGGHGGHDHE